MIPDTGLEWIVDARGCPAAALGDLEAVRGCCDGIVAAMRLHVVGVPQWRKFDGPGGVTGLYLLSESHLTCHTFPEFGLICLNVYCCRPRVRPDWERLLRAALGAEQVVVRELIRGLRDDESSRRPLIRPVGHLLPDGGGVSNEDRARGEGCAGGLADDCGDLRSGAVVGSGDPTTTKKSGDSTTTGGDPSTTKGAEDLTTTGSPAFVRGGEAP